MKTATCLALTAVPTLAILSLFCPIASADPPTAAAGGETGRKPTVRIPPTPIPSIVGAVEEDESPAWTPADPRWQERERDAADIEPFPAGGPLDPYDYYYSDEFRYHDFGRYGRFYMPHGYYYGYDPYGIQRSVELAYRRGRYDERFYGARIRGAQETKERTKRLLNRHEQAVRDGVDQLQTGDYARAVASFTLAAKLNQGDPACRIHLMQAKLALGQYEQAAAALRRALELQPKLIYLELSLDRYYIGSGTLNTLSDNLRRNLAAEPAAADVHFLHAFLEYQRGELTLANRTLRRLADLRPDDELVRDLLELTVADASTTGAESSTAVSVSKDPP